EASGARSARRRRRRLEADRVGPFGGRVDEAPLRHVEQTEHEGRVAGHLAVRLDHLLPHLADLPFVREQLAADDDRLARGELAQELGARLEDDRPGLRPADDVDAEAALGDDVPARLLEELEVARVVQVAERVEVRLADADGLVEDLRHAVLYSAAAGGCPSSTERKGRSFRS